MSLIERTAAHLRRISLKLYHTLSIPMLSYLWTRMHRNASYRHPVTVAKTARAKPHVLFVTEKWCDCKPELGTTNSAHNLWGSLHTSGLATYDCFHFDEYLFLHNRPGDSALLKLCMHSQPDLLLLTWTPLASHNSNRYNPKLATLHLIRTKMRIPIVAIWFDSVLPPVMRLAESLLPLVNLNVVVDSPTAYLKSTHHPEKYLPLWTPQDSRVFHNPRLERDIDVSFTGSLVNRSDRWSGIAALKANGVEVHQTGGQREKHLPVDEYARVYMRSKIALNFCSTGPHIQTKGRVFEATLCGALLMEAENSQTAKWFEPMTEYVAFRDESDLVGKVKYYLAHSSERREIAMRGHQKAKERYTGEMFWQVVLGKYLGLFAEKGEGDASI